MTFNCISPSIVFQEVPNEISLCFSISGCNIGCKGCHSTELWNKHHGTQLTNKSFLDWLNKYQGLITCVCFFGGEWQAASLIEKLVIANKSGLKSCLYSGRKHIDISITQHLTYLKTGPWIPELGGLNQRTTNQQFIEVSTGKNLNHLFRASDLKTHQGEENYVAA